MNHDSPQHDEIMEESLYYLRWSFVFGVVAFIAQITSFVELVKNEFKHGIVILIAATVSYFISGKLNRKADDLFKEAHYYD